MREFKYNRPPHHPTGTSEFSLPLPWEIFFEFTETSEVVLTLKLRVVSFELPLAI